VPASIVYSTFVLSHTQEIKQILAYAVEWNTVREAVNVRLQAFDSWRQVTEVLLSGCPAECLGDKRPDIIVNILNALIRKVSDGFVIVLYAIS